MKSACKYQQCEYFYEALHSKYKYKGSPKSYNHQNAIMVLNVHTLHIHTWKRTSPKYQMRNFQKGVNAASLIIND